MNIYSFHIDRTPLKCKDSNVILGIWTDCDIKRYQCWVSSGSGLLVIGAKVTRNILKMSIIFSSFFEWLPVAGYVR